MKTLFTQILTIVLLTKLTVAAQAAAPKKSLKSIKNEPAIELSVKEQALKEIPTSQNANNQNPVLENWGLISVKNPFPTTEVRSWKYILGLKLQKWQPQGEVLLLTEKLNLGSSQSGTMPYIEFGTKKYLGSLNNLSSNQAVSSWSADWGLLGDFGYLSQANNFEFKSGYKTTNTKLNSVSFNIGPQLILSQSSWWNLLFAFQLGFVSYSQSSETDLATFTRQIYNYSFLLGAEFKLTENLGVLAQTSLKEMITKNAGLTLPNNNLEAGLRLTW